MPNFHRIASLLLLFLFVICLNYRTFILAVETVSSSSSAVEEEDDPFCAIDDDGGAANNDHSSFCTVTATAIITYDEGNEHDDAATSLRRRIHAEVVLEPRRFQDASSSSSSSCRLYLAPRGIDDNIDAKSNSNDSSFSEHPNQDGQRTLGVYLSTHLPKGAPLTVRGGDMMLPLIDVDPFLDHRVQHTGADATAARRVVDDGNGNGSNGSRNRRQSTLSQWNERGYLQRATTSPHGGNYEGLGTVANVLPGLAMLASDPPRSELRPNIWAATPEADEADLPRHVHPAAGAFALQYNLTYFVTVEGGIEEGGEVWVDRWGWHQRLALGLVADNDIINDNDHDRYKRDIGILRQHGTCLDNLHPGRSSHPDHGRGAMASRFLPKGSVVAPVPVLPIPREELRYLRKKEWKEVERWRNKIKKETEMKMSLVLQTVGHARVEGDGKKLEMIENDNYDTVEEVLPPGMKWRQQLLLNYCFGHVNSTVLLFPYGLFVNFINHAPSEDGFDGPVANVGLRWSERYVERDPMSGKDPRTMSPEELFSRPNPAGLVLEYVALRDIRPNDEILFDYGSLWADAWNEHVKNHPPSYAEGNGNDYVSPSPNEYTPAYIMEEVATNLRTAEEQLTYPYPDNVFTACFYRYSDRKDDSNDYEAAKEFNKESAMINSKAKTKAIPWKMSRGLFDMTNLRPCKVIDREPTQTGGKKMVYTAIIQNRPDLPPEERIPKGVKHIVSGIPREAFRFVDRPYTSDVHMEGAFRQNIGLEGLGVFPTAWLDLKTEK